MSNHNCPEKADLRDFLLGHVSDFHADSIGSHIHSFETCLKFLDELDQEVIQRLGLSKNSPSE